MLREALIERRQHHVPWLLISAAYQPRDPAVQGLRVRLDRRTLGSFRKDEEMPLGVSLRSSTSRMLRR
jgi:hypothetical protein